MIKKICLIFALMFLLGGCSGGNEPAKKVTAPEQEIETEAREDVKAGYSFEYKGVTISLNREAAPVVEKLGEPLEYFEAESCAFQGLDKTYYYSGFELYTYPVEDVDYVSSILLIDDSVSTPEGIYLGSSLEDVLEAYGDEYLEENGLYTYTSSDSKLSFIIEEDTVASIEYIAITD